MLVVVIILACVQCVRFLCRERKERERAERERLEREKAERERQERERAERERAEKERKEQERLKREQQERIERTRVLKESAEAAAAVNQHFTESLRLASQKVRNATLSSSLFSVIVVVVPFVVVCIFVVPPQADRVSQRPA